MQANFLQVNFFELLHFVSDKLKSTLNDQMKCDKELRTEEKEPCVTQTHCTSADYAPRHTPATITKL